MKVNVIEEPACRRVLEIEIPAEDVERELEALVEDYRRDLALPGFRKGKAPREMVRARISDKLEGDFLKRALPRAYVAALEETRLNPAGEPEIRDLQFRPGEPLRFRAHVEVWPDVQVTGYREISLVREEFEVTDEEIDRSLQLFRESQATSEAVDRPAQGGDLVATEYWVLDAEGKRGEMKEGAIEVGGPGTPEPFNQALMGVNRGESRRVLLPGAAHTTEEGVHEHPEQVFELLVKEVRERRLPALDDAFARAALGSETAGLEDLRARIRLNLEGQEKMRSREQVEEALLAEIVARTPFELPPGPVGATLEDVVARARQERGTLSPEDEARLRETWQPVVERRLRTDLIIQAVGRQEGLTITDEEVDAEIARFAEREGKPVAEVRGKMKREDMLDRLKDDMFRHKVLQTLLGLAKIDVIKKRR